MNSVKLRGVVDTIKKYNNDKGAGVRITISFWGFRKTFFFDVNDKLLDFLKEDMEIEISGKLYEGKNGLGIDIQQVDNIG